MPTPDYILLYVENPAASARFYAELLGRQPVEASPGFVLFVSASGAKLGLWARSDVQPQPSNAIDGAEIAFTLTDAAAVHAAHDDFRVRGWRIAQPPTEMDFGTTFVMLDPDGHRLRFFAPIPQ
jgi:catechol 2,3-dioxygenase-like lactoylglutathione lyase family enzyme